MKRQGQSHLLRFQYDTTIDRINYVSAETYPENAFLRTLIGED